MPPGRRSATSADAFACAPRATTGWMADKVTRACVATQPFQGTPNFSSETTSPIGLRFFFPRPSLRFG